MRPSSPRDMLSRMTNEPTDPMKATRTRGDARQSLLTQVRKDIRTLVAKIPPLEDDKQAEDELLNTLRLLLARYDELTK